MLDDDRDVRAVRLPQWGRVAKIDDPVGWLVLDDSGVPVVPIRRFLTDFVAQGNSPRSVRSYAYALLRWWRWLRALNVEWDKATPAEGRDLVLWLGWHEKPRNSPRTASLETVGTVNAITGKRYLDDRYAVRTMTRPPGVGRV